MMDNIAYSRKESKPNFARVSLLAGIAVFVLLSALAAALLPALAAQSSNPTPTVAVNLSNDSPTTATNPMVVSAGSYVYVAWSEAAGGIKFRYSPDNGSTWIPPLALPATTISYSVAPYGASQFPIMYANGSDVYISWSQDYGMKGLEIFVATSLDNGTTFTISQLTNTSGIGTTTKGGYITPAIAASGPNVYVTFSGNGSNSYVMTSNNYGLTWSKPTLYSSSLEDEVAAWGNNGYAIADHAVAATHNAGKTWKVVIGSKSFHGDEPMIAAYGPYVYVTTELPNGTNRADSYIRVYYSDDSGLKFNSIKNLSPLQNDSWAPMVGAYGSSAWIAFRTYPGGAKGTIWEYTTTDGGQTWSPMGNSLSGVGGKGSAETFPFEVVSTDGQNVFVGWSHQVKAGHWTFMVSASSNGGLNWSLPPGIDMSQNAKGEAGFEIDLANGAISSSGPNCYAVWQYKDGTTNQVYFASVTLSA
jgi:hypothetical protein